MASLSTDSRRDADHFAIAARDARPDADGIDGAPAAALAARRRRRCRRRRDEHDAGDGAAAVAIAHRLQRVAECGAPIGRGKAAASPAVTRSPKRRTSVWKRATAPGADRVRRGAARDRCAAAVRVGEAHAARRVDEDGTMVTRGDVGGAIVGRIRQTTSHRSVRSRSADRTAAAAPQSARAGRPATRRRSRRGTTAPSAHAEAD
jgi:hypothetical protein